MSTETILALAVVVITAIVVLLIGVTSNSRAKKMEG